MARTILGYSALAVVAILVAKLVFGLLGFAISLLWSILWFAALGFIVYLVIRIVSPATADKIRETVQGNGDRTDQ